jgi:hypothetical protein
MMGLTHTAGARGVLGQLPPLMRERQAGSGASWRAASVWRPTPTGFSLVDQTERLGARTVCRSGRGQMSAPALAGTAAEFGLSRSAVPMINTRPVHRDGRSASHKPAAWPNLRNEAVSGLRPALKDAVRDTAWRRALPRDRTTFIVYLN